MDVKFTPVDKYNGRLFIEKSAPLNYNLEFDVLTPDWEKCKKTINLQLEALSQHFARLGTVALWQVENEAEIQYFLPHFPGWNTASSLTAIQISTTMPLFFKAPTPKSGEPFSSPWFPLGPRLRHLSSESKWAYMFPSNLSQLTTLELHDIDLELADCRKLFSETKQLEYLRLRFTRRSDHHHELHDFKIEELIELPSLAYFSIQLPNSINSKKCPCILPLFFMPHLKVLDVAREPDRCPASNGDLGHFHPRNAKQWNSPSSPFRKVRFHGEGWTWSENAFIPGYEDEDEDAGKATSKDPQFLKVIDLEWVDSFEANRWSYMYNDEPSSKLEVNLHWVSFTEFPESWDDENDADWGPIANSRISFLDVAKIMDRLASELKEEVILQLPVRFEEFELIWINGLRKRPDDVYIEYSDQVLDIRFDIREGGIDFPRNF